jgi:nucleoid DNA-binding protein
MIKNQDDIVKVLAAEFKLDLEIVEKIIKSEFKFIADTMSEGNFESVHLHHFGKIAAKPNRVLKYKDYNAWKELKKEH